MQTRILLTLFPLLALSNLVAAKAPAHAVFPQTNALSVSYAVESNEIRAILSVTNHEEFAVLCGASMKADNKEILQKQKDSRIDTGKTQGFTFKYRPSVEKFELFLVCEPVAESREAAKQAKTARENSGHIIPVHDNEKTSVRNSEVLIEDLGKH